MVVQPSPSLSSNPNSYTPTSPQSFGTPNGVVPPLGGNAQSAATSDLRAAIKGLSSVTSSLPAHFDGQAVTDTPEMRCPVLISCMMAAILSATQDGQTGVASLEAADRRRDFDGQIQQHGAILGSKGVSPEGMQSYNQLHQLWKSTGSILHICCDIRS